MAEDLQILKSQLAALRAKPSLPVGERIAAYNLEQAIRALEVVAKPQPVTIAKLPTPVDVTGEVTVDTALLATSANQTTEITALGTLNTSVNTLLKPADTLTKVTTVDTITNPVAVTGTFYQATQPVSAASLPLPAGASTLAEQQTQTASLASIDGKDFATQTTLALIKAKTDNLDVALSTRNLEATQLLIKAKTDNIPPLGQALAAASTPVVLTAAQVTTLTPPAAITGFATEATLASIDAGTPAALGQATMANSMPVVIASDQSAVPVTFTGSTDVATQTTLAAMNAKLVTGTDIGDVTINNANGASAVHIQDGGNTITVDGAVTVTNATAANLKAEVVGTGTFVTQATLAAETTKVIGTVNVSTGQTITDVPATSGGLSKFHLVAAATDNATNIKASAGQVYAITAFNLNAAARYLKFHNTAGTPTVGSGVTDTYMIPGNTAGAGLVLNIDKGIVFGTGIGITIVTGIADSNTTAVAASEIVVNIYYK